MISFSQFTTDFAEFANAAAYPESAFNFYANFASIMISQDVWGPPAAAGQPNTLYDIGCELFIAHNLYLERMNQQAAAGGAAPGASTGAVSGKSVGPVSISYDTSVGIDPEDGQWNLSNYGTRFIQTAKLLGAGPMQVGPLEIAPPNSGPGWIGPPPFPGWFSS